MTVERERAWDDEGWCGTGKEVPRPKGSSSHQPGCSAAECGGDFQCSKCDKLYGWCTGHGDCTRCDDCCSEKCPMEIRHTAKYEPATRNHPYWIWRCTCGIWGQENTRDHARSMYRIHKISKN